MTFDDVELELSRRTGVGLKYAYGRVALAALTLEPRADRCQALLRL